MQGNKCSQLESLIKSWKSKNTHLKPHLSTFDGIANGHSIYDAAVCARDNLGTIVEGIEGLEKSCVERWWNMYHDQGLSRLSMGRFVGEVADGIKSGAKLGIYSG